MEGSRRSAVREPGPKKPRLPDDSERDREQQPPRDPRGSGSSQSLNPRLRPGEREREEKDDSTRSVGSYQELMAQYKTALAELIFNSKPIITNLTIIAGENQHVAKEITAIICANIVQVPSEQKLPSLYLLDSIVKNIGRDYVKYFAARLPEVFCKAYKQVDSSIHPSMRHLFGTWKGVFPSAALQIIEKELGFPTAINGSSGATASKTESQATQRQPHGIHVNPKYLEARQRLQQSSKKAKDTSCDDTSGGVNQVDDADMYARTAIVGSTRQRTEMPINKPNIQHPQREPLNDPIHEKKGYRDVKDFSPDIPRQSSDLGVGRINEKVKVRDGLDKPFHGAGAIASEISTNRRNDFDANNVYGAYQPSGSAQTDGQLPSFHLNNTNKSNRSTPNNWKNSEEEEFMWDDMNSRLADYGGSNSTIKGVRNSDTVDKSVSLQRGKWMPEHLDSHWNQFDTSRFRKTPGGEDRRPLFRDIEEHLPQPHGQQDPDPRINIETTAHPLSAGRTASGHHASLLWPPREPPPSAVSLNNFNSRISSQSESRPIPHSGGFSLSSSLPRPGPLPHTIPSRGSPFFRPVGVFGQQRQQALQPLSPSARSPPAFMPIQHPRPHNSIDDHLHSNPLSQIGQKPVPHPGQWNRAPQAPLMQDSFPILPQSHTQQSRTSLNSQPSHLLQTSATSSASLAQMRHHLPLLQSSQPDLVHQQTQQSQPSVKTEKLPLSFGSHQTEGFSGTNLSNNNPADVPGQSNTSNLLASIMKSGILSNNPSGSFQNLNVQPPLPSGPPPIQILTLSAPLVTPSSLTFSASHGKAPAPVPPPIRAMLPPLPPGPPPASSLVATTSEVSNTSNATLNPFSGLLSSLLAKGIISSPATELPVVTSAQILNKLPNQTSGLASSALVVTSAQIPNKLPNQTSGLASSALALCPSTSATSTIPPAPVKKLDIPESSAPTTTTELEKPVGFDFKPESIREFHPLVINSLFDDLTHQCNVCGLRFRLQEQLDNHLDWHASKKSEMANFERVSRQWFADKSNWVDGSVGPPCGPMAMAFLEDVAHGGEKSEEPMVPADESQSICALCGEPFEDVYSDEMDEWMYKGTVYLNSTRKLGDAGSTDETMGPGPIVHAKCVSNSVDNIEVNGDNKEG